MKNELSSAALRELLERMTGILYTDGEKLSLIQQHNYKQFLLSEGNSELYPNIGKKRERIVTISFMQPRKITLKHHKGQEKDRIYPAMSWKNWNIRRASSVDVLWKWA